VEYKKKGGSEGGYGQREINMEPKISENKELEKLIKKNG
jgi:hypothetical protein